MCNNIHIVCLAGPKALLFSYFRKIKEEVYEKFQGNEAACSRNQR